MATYTPLVLSGSDNGRPIKVAATATPGTTIHTSDAAAKDKVSLTLYNADTVARTVTLEWGGTTSPDDLIAVTVQPKDSYPVSGMLSGGKALKAFADAANVIRVLGSVQRIS